MCDGQVIMTLYLLEISLFLLRVCIVFSSAERTLPIPMYIRPTWTLYAHYSQLTIYFYVCLVDALALRSCILLIINQ